MIELAASLGARRINFHDLLKCGIPRDLWTGAWNLSMTEWIALYNEVQRNIDAGKYRIHVRIPQCFVTQEEFQADPEYYGYCPAKMGERVLVHPNGMIRICSLLIGTPYAIARFYDRKIVWDESPTNELRAHQLSIPTPCTNQFKRSRSTDYLPLCVSFKPRQLEIVWAEKLRWEDKRKNLDRLNHESTTSASSTGVSEALLCHSTSGSG
jgi:sulfatase maturation enzyme AslB (radical SAM superfamily)